jgi:hypothetical protein
MNRTLDTWPDEVPPADAIVPSDLPEHSDLPGYWQSVMQIVRRGVEEVGELFVGMANGPYLLLFRPRDPQEAIAVLDRGRVQDVSIHWSSEVENGTEWTVSSLSVDDEFELRFSLPEPVAAWIFENGADVTRRALAFKESFLSTITLYRFVDGEDRLYRLRFSPPQVGQSWRARRR